MSARIQTTIETSQSTVILLSHNCVFSSQLQAAIETVHLTVVRVEPIQLQKSTLEESVKKLLQSGYVCVWVDIPLFVSQREKEIENSAIVEVLKKHLHIPLHLVTFDPMYERKNGREGDIPTIATKQLIASVLRHLKNVSLFSYNHVIYPYEGGISIVQRFLLEKIKQGNRQPLSGSWTPLWYQDVLSHLVATLYDLSITGSTFSGPTAVDLELFESHVRIASHNQALTGHQIDFPFEFQSGRAIGNVPLKTMVDELSLVTITRKIDQHELVSKVDPHTVFSQKKQKPSVVKRKKRMKTVFKSVLGIGVVLLLTYGVVSFVFFTLLGNVRSTIAQNIQSDTQIQWQPKRTSDLSKKIQILEAVAHAIPLPYSVVGIHLPHEGVVAGLHSVSQYVSGIQSYHEATDLLSSRIEQATMPDIATQNSSQQISTLLDEAYKDLSAIQADISKGNPIFDSLFGIDGLSSQLVQSTTTLRESITQSKALVTLVDSLLGKEGKAVFLLVSVDSTQSRPFFGQPTQIAVFTIEDGKVKSTQIHQVSDLDHMIKGKVEPPKEMQKYVENMNWKLSDGSWSVDGPTAAREIAWFVGKQLNLDVDALLFVSTPTLGEMTSIAAGAGDENSVGGDTSKKNVLGTQSPQTNVSTLLAKIGSGDTESVESFLPLIVESLNSSQSVLFSRDVGVAKTAKALAWDGSVRTPNCPALFAVDRACAVLTRYMTEYDVNSASESAVAPTQKENQVHKIHFANDALIHTDIVLYPKTAGREERKLIKYLIDQGATNISVEVNGVLVDEKELSLGQEYEKTSLSFPVLLSSNSMTTITLLYTTQPVSAEKSSVVLFVQKQAGKRADPLTVEMSFSKSFLPSVVAPKAFIDRAGVSFTTELTTSKIFAVGF